MIDWMLSSTATPLKFVQCNGLSRTRVVTLVVINHSVNFLHCCLPVKIQVLSLMLAFFGHGIEAPVQWNPVNTDTKGTL